VLKLDRTTILRTRETIEGWPLLTVETDLDGDSKSKNERGPSLVGSLGLSCWHKRFLFCWAGSRAGSPVS
jgi:hypothetical protein